MILPRWHKTATRVLNLLMIDEYPNLPVFRQHEAYCQTIKPEFQTTKTNGLAVCF